MMKSNIPIFAAVLLALVPCRAEVRIQNQIIVNGGITIFPGTSGGEEQKSDEASPAAAQVLEFSDGSRLHGTLEALDGAKKEIVWRGAEASAPIAFPLSQVSHWEFSPTGKVEVKARATVKFTGGDWLAADVTGLREGKVQLRLGDGTALAVDRAHVEWIYFSKTAAPECYDGPQNLSGWVSNGGWTYRDGALRASQPSVIGRLFEALPDQVEYQFEFDQGAGARAFAVLLHGPDPAARGFGQGMVRLMVNDANLQLWAQQADNMKQEQVDLSKILPAPTKAADGSPKRKPMRWRIFEDRPTGRLVVFIDGHKVADWNIGKGKVGENRGCFSFQPMAWNANAEQSLSKIRVMPWDGFVPVDNAIEDARPKADQVVLADGETKDGRIESMTSDTVKLGGVPLAREKIALLRFARPANPPDGAPSMARVRLAQRGEFDVAAVGFNDGKMRLRTNFGGELALPIAALRGVEFAHLAPVGGKPVDVLLFKNGDQLRGLLESAASGQKLRWRAAPGTPPVEMETARVAGVVIAPRGDRPPAKSGVLARCRNGDFVAGDLGALDKERLTLESAAAGSLRIPRDRVHALYFSTDGKLPVVDGAWEHERWEAGLDLNQRGRIEEGRKKAVEGKPAPSLWTYFDGAFTVKRASANRSNAYNNGNFNLGRVIEELPQRVDFSFDVIGKKNQVFFSAHLFSEPEQSGYMMQIHPAGLFIYDTGGQQRGRGMLQQQQIQFGGKVKADAPQHRIRVLADRPSGRVTLVVDGVVVGNFGPKAGAPPRNLGRGLGLTAQQNMACTFANLWIAPWNGQLPGIEPVAATPLDSVLLANGDEAQGTVGTATPNSLQLESEVGVLDLPVKRLTTVEFAARASESASGVRFRLADRSVFTATAYRIENATVVCQTAVAGEVTFPLGSVQEIVFAPAATPPPAKVGEKPAISLPAGAAFQRGGVRLFID